MHWLLHGCISTVLFALVVCDDKPLERLFLTKLIESGNISGAQNAALVRWNRDSLDDIPTYTGYLTVNETSNSNLFFWFIPAIDEDPEEAPVMLWLNGALDTSSTFGLFIENGPFSVKRRGRIPKLVIRSRKATWARQHSMLYIDNPVGTGFSFTDSKDGYSKDAVEVSNDLLKALEQFYKLFPDYHKQPLYIAGESYAGKYAPILANKILGRNNLKLANHSDINLAGIALGGPLTDPLPVYTAYGYYLNTLGLVSSKAQSEIKDMEGRIYELAQGGQLDKAYTVHEDLVNYFKNQSGFASMTNAWESRSSRKLNYYAQYLNSTSARRLVHAGTQPFYNTSDEAVAALRPDLFKSYKSELEQVISSGIKVLIYVGQYDLRTPHTAVSSFVDSLKTPIQNDFQNATRRVIREKKKGDVSGYVRSTGNLTYVILRNAGHHVPKDQSRWAREMIERFVKGGEYSL